MGGEQSRTLGNSGEADAPGAGTSEGRNSLGGGSHQDASRPLSTSPRPSICSEAELPYISYTVNRPIGDSPKHTGGRVVRGLRAGGVGTGVTAGVGGSPKRLRRRPQRPQEVIVVREAVSQDANVDPELARLKSIPTFLPIMRGALTAPSARDPEVLERLNAAALTALCRRYQVHLHALASSTSSAQDQLTAKVREVDSTLASLVTSLTERQKAFAKHAEKLAQVTEISHSLSRCHTSLNLILESLETLNDALPIQDRLEPFVWTTG